jgi:hypothetical protein
MVYSSMTAIEHNMNTLTSICKILLVCAASNLTDDYSIYILGNKFGGRIGSVAVE